MESPLHIPLFRSFTIGIGIGTVASKVSRKKRGRPARRDEAVGPTPETLAKLRQDPLLALLERYGDEKAGGEEGTLERAADEVRAIYLAVCGMLMAGVGGGHRYGQGPGGRREIPPFLAWAHAETYLPWANGLKRGTLEAVIDLVVDRRVIHPDLSIAVAAALTEYATRMRRRGPFEEPDQAPAVGIPDGRIVGF